LLLEVILFGFEHSLDDAVDAVDYLRLAEIRSFDYILCFGNSHALGFELETEFASLADEVGL
jgi:hypothetical protein